MGSPCFSFLLARPLYPWACVPLFHCRTTAEMRGEEKEEPWASRGEEGGALPGRLGEQRRGWRRQRRWLGAQRRGSSASGWARAEERKSLAVAGRAEERNPSFGAKKARQRPGFSFPA